tara:strand:- start:1126 stop:1788 length:663 start_codon:yes stop_codon:yes gene_type:complete
MIRNICWVFEGDRGLSQERCDFLVKRGLETEEQVATHQNKNQTISQDDDVRSSRVSWLHGEDIYDCVRPFVNRANEEAGWRYDLRQIENVQFTKYGINQHYDWHIDGDCDHFATKLFKKNEPGATYSVNETPDEAMVGLCRKLSVSIQLSHSEDYEGGDMYFTELPKNNNITELDTWTDDIFRKRGTVLVFPSFIRHKVMPVTKGTRYSAVAWFNGPPLR